jgi:rhodanese-related sulfurtransferase/DNA-binding transcriptional ArsR family regulator
VKSEAYGQVARLGRALGSGSRLELLELIAQAEQPVEVRSRMSGIAVTSVSSHLQVLKAAGLVRTRRQGATILYRLPSEGVAELFVTLTSVAVSVLPELQFAEQEAESRGCRAPVPMARSIREIQDAFILDVRPAHEYAAGHYPRAMSIPLEELPERAGEVPTGRRVVVYCRGEFCVLARNAARLLRARGVDVSAMDEGVSESCAGGQIELGATA